MPKALVRRFGPWLGASSITAKAADQLAEAGGGAQTGCSMDIDTVVQGSSKLASHKKLTLTLLLFGELRTKSID
jgi:hypothetical protein